MYLYILFNFQRPFSFTTFAVTFCFFLSPSSASFSISLDLDHVNNFFLKLFCSFFKVFSKFVFSCYRSQRRILSYHKSFPLLIFLLLYKIIISYFLYFSILFIHILLSTHHVKFIKNLT